MSDTVLMAVVALLGTFSSAIVAILMMLVKWKIDRSDKLWAITNAAAIAASEAAARTLAAIEEQKQSLAIIEKHGNSITEELVKVTSVQQLALGKKIGMEQEKAEQAVIAKARLEGSREIQKEISKEDK